MPPKATPPATSGRQTQGFKNRVKEQARETQSASAVDSGPAAKPTVPSAPASTEAVDAVADDDDDLQFDDPTDMTIAPVAPVAQDDDDLNFDDIDDLPLPAVDTVAEADTDGPGKEPTSVVDPTVGVTDTADDEDMDFSGCKTIPPSVGSLLIIAVDDDVVTTMGGAGSEAPSGQPTDTNQAGQSSNASPHRGTTPPATRAQLMAGLYSFDPPQEFGGHGYRIHLSPTSVEDAPTWTYTPGVMPRPPAFDTMTPAGLTTTEYRNRVLGALMAQHDDSTSAFLLNLMVCHLERKLGVPHHLPADEKIDVMLGTLERSRPHLAMMFPPLFKAHMSALAPADLRDLFETLTAMMPYGDINMWY
ncbi:hypothetical protein CONPUDRAFT_78434 [Coniophora puteana RWD-64-598 SS2]|uniref:Uncharacterized protein n=1 Tax=Coniophora puteana (strain RWD-64-598) TaxID=741705 RepID=R7SCL3_CONPW|nr:uncharacterized protein CONPUDRAFT_78434 [Coniophora puteana RWD-64-598 SS2]EIW73906.1 hypothetical protein CONPUDRAFT_78434 [Coniophora puteana RWD-64-598 SS2]